MAYRRVFQALAAILLVSSFGAPRALAHCDTMDGPVIKDAMLALESRDVTPVLKWVEPEKEPEIRRIFEQTLAVRGFGPEARAVSDRFFFESLVRIHREGEGAPYTGLKPAGTEIEPAVAASDKALEAGSVDAVTRMLVAAVEQGIRERFERAASARVRASESVKRGREYVAAYVEFVHYAERLHADAASGASHHEHENAAGRHDAGEHLR